MKPPLALSAVSVAADGSETTWWSGDKYAYNRPQSLSFRTRIGEGFSDAAVTLARRIDQDYNDLELFNDIVCIGDDGQVAYEGRIGSTPRSTSGGHSIQVQCAGWMAHAKDRKFQETYVNRKLDQWGPMSTARRLELAGKIIGGQFQVQPDSSGYPALAMVTSRINNVGAGDTRCDEPWYVSRVPIGSVYYDFDASATMGAGWNNQMWLLTQDSFGGSEDAGTVHAGVDAAATLSATDSLKFYAMIESYLNSVLAAQDGSWQGTWRNVAVFGRHGLTKRGAAPEGFYASDMIRDIAARFCPKLNTAGVEDTTLVIPHADFQDRTTPFDAFLLLNGPHGYELAVWENKTLTLRPYDLSDYDWQVGMDQPGVDLSLQGDTTEGLANYVVVEFDNVATGQRDSVSPSDDSSLEDTTADHPANTHGLDVELTVGLTFPTTTEVAIAFGQSYLGEFNRPKNRGQITMQGHLLDNASHWQQPWRVRAGETISVVDHPNDTPRLITETSYDHPSRTVTISTDNGELNQLDAVVDYIRTSLTAANIA